MYPQEPSCWVSWRAVQRHLRDPLPVWRGVLAADPADAGLGQQHGVRRRLRAEVLPVAQAGAAARARHAGGVRRGVHAVPLRPEVSLRSHRDIRPVC